MNVPVGDTLVFKRGLNPTPMALAPLLKLNVRGLLKVTAVLLSAQVAAIDSPASVVADTPVWPLMAACHLLGSGGR